MASIISAGTSAGTALNLTGDTSGILQLASNNGTVGLTIDASQNIGIGTASPSSKLQVAGNVTVNAGGGNTYGQFISGSSTIQVGTNGTSQFIYGTGAVPLTFSTNAVEAMRISSAGEVGIGTATPISNCKLTINRIGGSPSISGTTDLVIDGSNANGVVFLNAYSSGNVVSNVGGGNLLVGASTAYATLGPSVQVVNSGGKGQYAAGPGNPAQTYTFGRDNVTTGLFVFTYNGNVISTINSGTGAYTAVSDSRLKKNITSLQYGLNEILKLNPVTYNMKTEEDSVKKHIGLIAQEVKSVMDESVDDLIDQENQMYGLDKSGLVPVLIKAIQEQQALIDNLTTRLAALEGAK